MAPPDRPYPCLFTRRMAPAIRRKVAISAKTLGKIEFQPLVEYENDPVRFCDEVLGIKLWHKQEEIMRAVLENERVSVAACYGSGKTFTAACLVMFWLFTRRPAMVITTAPTGRQVKTLLWREVRKLFRKAKKKLAGRLLQTRLELADDWFGMGFASDAPNSVAGLHEARNVLFIEDEAAGMEPHVVEGFEGITASENSHHLKIGNPICSSGPFFDSHMHPEEKKRWKRITIDAEDTPNVLAGPGQVVVPGLVTWEWVDDKRHRWLKRGLKLLWETKVKGRFYVTSSEKVISALWASLAQGRWVDTGGNSRECRPPAPPAEGQKPAPRSELPVLSPLPDDKPSKWKRILGVDVAVGGKNKTSLYFNEQGYIYKVADWCEEDTMVQGRDIVAWVMKLNAEILNIDCTGPGKGVGDKVRELKSEGLIPDCHVNYIFMNVGSTEKDTYNRFSDELHFIAREAFDPNSPDPVALDPWDPGDAARQLALRNWTLNKGQRIQCESKTELEARGEESPDDGDAAELACYQGGGIWWN